MGQSNILLNEVLHQVVQKYKTKPSTDVIFTASIYYLLLTLNNESL